FLAIRIADETIPTLALTAMRFMGAGTILLTICLVRRERFPTDRRVWIDQALNGIVMVSIANTCVVWAEHYITSGLAALLAAMIPLWMGVLEAATGSAPFTRRKSAGLLLGFAGVAILVAPGLRAPETNLQFFLAVGAMQINCIGWNVGALRSKMRPANAGPMAVATIQMLTGGIVLTLVTLVTGDFTRVVFTTRSLAALLYLMLFGSVIAYSAFLYALGRIRPGKLTLYAYVNPAVAVIVGWLLLREPITIQMIVAMLVILGGVAVARR
ncbi:MAG TPA: EamA family transporter, partial [Thermoanaerobaculia bacterium]|nr:EamA family transporter [Thermoanaerobaculia bacterium]